MDAILKNNFQNILAGYQKVADYTVSGSAITNYDFTGLNITKEDDYMLVSYFDNGYSGINNNYTFWVNGYNSHSNYWQQRLTVEGTSLSPSRFNEGFTLSFLSNGAKAITITKIKLTNNGNVVWQSNSNTRIGSSSIGINTECGTSTFTATLINSIRITCTYANGLGIGSRFQLYKRVAPIIADITVSTATTSIDITGLSIDKGSEYMLVSSVVNTTASESNIYSFINSNTTITNYYTQVLSAYDATVGGARLNYPRFSTVYANSKTIGYSNIKLTNNSYYTFQTNASRGTGTSSVELNLLNGTSTFTATSITSLSIVASVSNAIGVGSRFQLIKLK